MRFRAREWMITICLIAGVMGTFGAGPASAASPGGNGGSFVLTATSPGGTYAPTFTGNGMLGVRVPPVRPGLRRRHGPRAVRARRLLRQLSDRPALQPGAAAGQHPDLVDADVLGRAARRSRCHGPDASGWRQSIDLHTGIVTTRRSGPRPTDTSPTSATRS